MGIYIKDIEMPLIEPLIMKIKPDGSVHTTFSNGYQKYEAISVPPHGRLKDVDALMRSNKNYVYTQTDIDLFPTVIPASEETED